MAVDRCTGGTGAPMAVRRGRDWLLAAEATGGEGTSPAGRCTGGAGGTGAPVLVWCGWFWGSVVGAGAGTAFADRWTGGRGAPIAVRRGRVRPFAVGPAFVGLSSAGAGRGWPLPGAMGVGAALVDFWEGRTGPLTGLRLLAVGVDVGVGSGAGPLVAVRWAAGACGALCGAGAS
ncbi:hypothetical protein G3I45_23245, partial [Streptomyces sp. SID339]|nr:hypothetical protein [Streptomyces sp. SID339]